ncbi:MAG TPA: iron ABC transporter permease [Fimbriimonas sp.]|nr:iron ABC transporter permease [Fimbriimonas sp.]
MRLSARIPLVAAICVLVLGFLIHIGVGASHWSSPWDIAREIFRGNTGEGGLNNIVWSLRLPRACQAVAVGAILGTVGVALQTVFRNPLAEPYVIGASSGAAIGAAGVYVVGASGALLGLAMPLAGFGSAILTLQLVMMIAKRRGIVETPNLLLAGVVISTMLGGLLSYIILRSGHDQGEVLRWLLGSLSEAFWGDIALISVFAVAGLAILVTYARRLNAFTLGEEGAAALGTNPSQLRTIVLFTATAMISVTVGVVGIIGFVGLVSPHIARKMVGIDLRRTLPLSAVLGSLLLLLSDLIAQRGIQGSEYPVGIVTALLGAPVLLFLLKRR